MADDPAHLMIRPTGRPGVLAKQRRSRYQKRRNPPQ
jgi:hypothetical protein